MKNRSAFSTARSTHRTLNHKKSQKLYFHYMEMLSFAMIYVSMLSCLLWSNYNFLLVMFGYFLWVCRCDLMALQLNKSLAYLCLVYDILFIFMEMIQWNECEQIKKRSVQSGLHGMHNFSIACYCVIFLLRLGFLFFLERCQKILSKGT